MKLSFLTLLDFVFGTEGWICNRLFAEENDGSFIIRGGSYVVGILLNDMITLMLECQILIIRIFNNFGIVLAN